MAGIVLKDDIRDHGCPTHVGDQLAHKLMTSVWR
jgi:hypothetical protein